MGLAIDIAFTHIRSRLRQTLVGVLGVATGVGFSVMMASLMEGSQRDFIAQLVDSLPHITVSDERRTPPPQRRPCSMTRWKSRTCPRSIAGGASRTRLQ